jgi:transcriptional regulator with XRE-family HTH domain
MSKLTPFQRLEAAMAAETQIHWGNVLGVSRGSIANWWMGKTSPDLPILIRIQQETGVSLDWLATGKGPMLLSERTLLIDAEMLRVLRQAIRSAAREAAAKSVAPDVSSVTRLAETALQLYKDEILSLGSQIPPVQEVTQRDGTHDP